MFSIINTILNLINVQREKTLNFMYLYQNILKNAFKTVCKARKTAIK